MNDYRIIKYMYIALFLTKDCKHDTYNTEGIWSHNWREQNCCANNFLLKKKKSGKNLLSRFSAKHVQQVLLVLVSNDLHMSFVWIWPYQMHGDETHFTMLPFI